MRALPSQILFFAAFLAFVVAAPVAASDDQQLDAFGGPAWPDYYIDSQLAEVAPQDPENPHPLLAQNPSADDVDDANDPLEPLNRAFFGFNEVVYGIVLDPLATTYNTVFPDTFRSGVSNLIDHVGAPVTLVNDLLQFEFDRAMITVARFVVNTVAGIGGIADAASGLGFEEHEEDFGQTLGVYGLGEGLYLVLPLLGPSNPRDAIGKYLVDPFFDPLGLYLENTERDAARYSRMGVTALDEYASIQDELKQIRKTSVDYYAAIRSLYRQKRASLIANGADEGLPDIPNYDLNFAPADDGPVAGVK